MLIGAHRGDINILDGYPENTFEAVTLAAARNADAIEFDVQRTSDNVWMLMHNETITATTNGTGDINDITAAQVESFVIDGGKGFVAARHVGLKVPRLETVLAALDGYEGILWFHTKDTPTSYHTDLATFINTHWPVEQAIVCADTTAGAAAIKAVNPAITTAYRDSTNGSKNAAIDIHLAEVNNLTPAWMALQTKPVWAYGDISKWNTEESDDIKDAYDCGALGYLGQHLRVNMFVRDLIEA